ncbi:hypothetical protein [Microbispora sp. NPDC049633]|uniref:hypothetical protein n=1 Tax=Microbispora sp. NPDC049633 TaxID=3154355 RepID=UPI00343AA82B
MTDGRTTEFTESARRNAAMFNTRQQGAGQAGYRPGSVLEPVISSTIGYSNSESSRLLPGGHVLPSPNGQAAETYQRRTWLSAI